MVSPWPKPRGLAGPLKGKKGGGSRCDTVSPPPEQALHRADEGARCDSVSPVRGGRTAPQSHCCDSDGSNITHQFCKTSAAIALVLQENLSHSTPERLLIPEEFTRSACAAMVLVLPFRF